MTGSHPAAGSTNTAPTLEADAAWNDLFNGLFLAGASSDAAPMAPPKELVTSAPLGTLLPADSSDLMGTLPSAIVTPQMLIQFFRPTGTNNLLPGLMTPVFAPPTPPGLSSTAVYRSH